MTLAGFAPACLLKWVLVASWILAALGILWCVAMAFVHRSLLTHATIKSSIKKQLGPLWLGQIFLMALSFFLFHFLETQTQLNTRLFSIETGYIAQTLQQQNLSLGLLPFIFYAVFGVGIAYFSIVLGRKPFLAWAPPRIRPLFLQNFMSVIIDLVTIGPFVFVSSFVLFWVCEYVNVVFDLGSLFEVPLRSVFILALLIFVFRGINKQLIAWMKQDHLSVGQILIIYVFAFAFFVSWLHSAGDWLTLAIAVPAGSEKSYFAGAFTPQSLHTRISYLIWGWWAVWTPWMASLVARSSVGCSMLRALIQALLLPVCLLGFGLQKMDLISWTLVYEWAAWPNVQLLGIVSVCVAMWVMWGQTRTFGDILRGAMFPIGRISARPLTRWMTLLMFWLTGYIPAWFILGWLPMQFMVTLGGLSMILVAWLIMSAFYRVLVLPRSDLVWV